ncbi:MAG: ABC transporter permease [Blastocatellia bacterium]
MQTLFQDLRFGARMIFKQPGFAALAVITLALGIGANTAIFSLLDQVLLRRLPVVNPDELVILRSPGPIRGHGSSDSDIATSFSVPMYKGLRDNNQVFAGLLARYAIPLSLSAQGQTERAEGELVSGNYFEMLGVRPALGRVFTMDDDKQIGAHPVAVLSHGYWTRRFASDPAVLHQQLLINGHNLTIVGVAQAGFAGVQVGQTPDVFIPLMMKHQMTPNWEGLEDWNDYWVALIGRLKPGLNAKQAEAGILPTYSALLAEQLPKVQGLPKETQDRFLAKRIELHPGAGGRQVVQSGVGEALWVLFGMVGLVLLIACTNVANLLLVRGLGRQREIAIRQALGAGRWRLMQQLLVESFLLSLAGALLGLLVAAWVSSGLVQIISGSNLGISGLNANLDVRVLFFTMLLSVLTGVLCGLVPAWRSTRHDLTPALKDQGTNASGSTSQVRLRKSLVVAQVTMTTLLLVGAGLLTRTLWNLTKMDLGLQPSQLLTFSVAPDLNGYQPEKVAQFVTQLREGLQALPGIQNVGVANVAAFAGDSARTNITVEKGPQDVNPDDQTVSQNAISPGYFATIGTALVAGREFAPTDTKTSAKVAIMNETAAKRFFPNRNPVGARMAFGAGNVNLEMEIVGVVRDAKHANVREDIAPFVFIPYTQDKELGAITFYVRSAQDAATVIPALRNQVKTLDANLPLYDIKTVETAIAENLVGERVMALLSLCFGGLAALLAGIGLYGVLAYQVVQRRREIGIRVALGASPQNVRWLVMGQGLRLTGLGIVLGLAGGYALAKLLTSMLFGVVGSDPFSYVIAASLLLAVALLACYWPARKATKVDPMIALRCE